MAALVADGVVRYAVNGTYDGHDVVNIVDIKIDTTGSDESREESAESVAGIIINEWSDSILPLLVENYQAVSVSWIDLDSLTGSVGERTNTDDHTWPEPGTTASSPMPGNVAARVNKTTVSARGQRQGRMYLCGVPEAWTLGLGPNRITADNVTAINAKLEDFLGDVNQDGSGILNYTCDMVVVHTKDGDFTSSTKITNLSIDGYLSSQVRRIRR
jgi:hypothetical protein